MDTEKAETEPRPRPRPRRAPVAAQPAWDPPSGTWVEPAATPVAEAPKRPDRPGLRAGVIGGIVGAIVAALVAIPVARMTAPDSPAVERQVQGLPAAEGTRSTIVDIAARARPWVVNVAVEVAPTSAFGGG